MKKKIFLVALIFNFLAILSFAVESETGFKPVESEKEFDVAYFLLPDMKQIEAKSYKDIKVTQAFSLNKDGVHGELRFTLFSETPTLAKFYPPSQGFWVYYYSWIGQCLMSIVGREVDLDLSRNFNPEDAKKEFNADLGCTITIKDLDSDYAKEYQYANVEFFYKKGQGLVMRTFLFNDMEFIFTKDGQFNPDCLLVRNYHSFKFMEKDKKGKYIKPKK